MTSRKTQWFWLCLWALLNVVGVAIAILTTFSLLIQIDANRYREPAHQLALLGRLAACGALQGIVLAGLQTTVLLAAKLRTLEWLATTVVAMAVGMVLPAMVWVIVPGEFTADQMDVSILTGWIGSWLLSGLACGIVAGQTRLEKVGRSIIHTAAHVWLGSAVVVGAMTAIAPTTADGLLTRLKVLIAALLGVMIGAWLSTYAFQGLYARKYERQSAKLHHRRDR